MLASLLERSKSWLGHVPQKPAVSHPIADAFDGHDVKQFDVRPYGISEIAIDYRGYTVSASWYAGNDPCQGRNRSICIDGKGLPVYGDEAQAIIHAAQNRARRVADEELSRLLSTETPPNSP